MRLTNTRVVLIIMAPALLLAAVLWLGGRLQSPLDHTDSLEIADLIVGGNKFRIPRAYLDLRSQWYGSWFEQNGVLMSAVLPGLGPYTNDKADYYKGGNTLMRDVVDFNLWPIKFGTGLQNQYFKPDYLTTCNGEIDGFQRCPLDWPKYQEVLVKVTGDRKVALVCDRERDRLADGRELNGLCRGRFPLVDRVELSIRFELKHRERADEVIARVYERVCGFLVRGAPALTYNYCENGVYFHGPQN